MTKRPEQGYEYDGILLGSGIASLVVGILLAKQEQSVLLLRGRGDRSDFRKEGYRFFPFSNLSERLLKVSTLKLLSQLVGSPVFLDVQDGREADPQRQRQGKREVAFQVILPTARIDLFYDRYYLEREWKREFGLEVTQIRQFYSEIERGKDPFLPFYHSPSLLRKLFSSESRLDLSSFSQEFRTYVELQMMAWSNFRPKHILPSLASGLLNLGEEGDWIFNRDGHWLEETLWQEYEQAGGRMDEIESIDEIAHGWRKGFTLLAEGGSRVFRSRYLVIHCPLHRLPPLHGRGRRSLDRCKKLLHPRYVIYPFFLGVGEEAIPVGMRDLLVSVADPQKPYDRGNLLYLSFSSEGDESQAPKGKRALTVASFVRWDKVASKESDSRWVEEQRDGVMEHLNQLMPFLDRHMEFCEFDRGRELLSCWSYPHLIYETDAEIRWGKEVVPRRLSRSLYVAGKENLPFLGLEGEILWGGKVGRDVLGKT